MTAIRYIVCTDKKCNWDYCAWSNTEASMALAAHIRRKECSMNWEPDKYELTE